MFDTCSFKPTNDGFPPSSGGGGGAVTSVFGRTGVVIAVAGDYTSSEITNSSTVTGTYVTDALNWLDTNKLGTSLTSANIIVGNGSNVATAVAMSGDATISNTGAVTLANSGVVASTYGSATQVPVFAVDSKGRVTSVTNTAITGFVPTSLTSANIIVGNASNVATAVAMSGDATISNTGALTISNQAVTFAKMQHISSQHLVGRHAAGTGDIQQISLGTGLSFSGSNLQVTGFVPTSLTSANIIVGNASNVATAVAMSGDATISNTGAVTLANSGVTPATYGSATQVPVFAVDSKGRVTSVTDTAITGFVPTTLTSANIIVGNGSNVATAVAMSGDATISNTGAVTLANSGVVASTYGSATQVPVFAVDSKGRVTSVTNTAITGGGTSYNVQSQTLSGNVVWNSTNFTPNNVQYLVTNDATTRILTINNTGFVAGSLIRVIVGSLSPGNITIVIGGMTFTQSRVSGIEALFDGTNWLLNPLIGGTNTGIGGSEQSFVVGYSANVPASSYAVAVGYNMNSSGTRSTTLGANVTNSQQDSVVIGQGASSTAINSVIIGQNASGSAAAQTIIGRSSSGSGTNQTLYGQGISAGSNTGVVAIGQGITTTNTDAVVIGRAASGGGLNNISIGAGATGTGNNCVRIGSSIATSTATGIIAIGTTISNPKQDNIIIGNTVGNGASGGTNINNLLIGNNTTTGQQSSGTQALNMLIGHNITIQNSTSGSKTVTRQIIIGNDILQEMNTANNESYQQNIIIGNNIKIGKIASVGNSNAVVIVSTNSGGTQFSLGNQIANSVIIGIGAAGGEVSGAGANTVVGYLANPSASGEYSVVIGSRASSGSGASLVSYNTMIGYNALNPNNKSRLFAKGAFAYPLHYGAESRRIDTNTSTTDATNPSRHDEKDAWNGTTTNNAITELFLFGVSNQRLTLQDNEILTATVQVQAKRNATTDCFVDTAFVSIVRGVGAGTVTLVLAPSSINTGFLGTGSTVTYTLDADTTNGSLRFIATGNTGETWQWTANIITYTRTRTA